MKLRNKRRVINVIILLLTVLILLFLLEVFLRALEPKKDIFTKYDENLVSVNIPNAEGYYCKSEFCNYIELNSKGLRDREYDYEKNNKYRIVVLGDSMMEGLEVSLNDSFQEILENSLGENYEVINFGVGGYSTDQEYLTLKEEGLKYNPDLVILAFLPINDVRDNYDFGIMPKNYFRIENGALTRENKSVSNNISTEKENGFIKIKSFISKFKVYSFFVSGLTKINFVSEFLMEKGLFKNVHYILVNGKIMPREALIYSEDYNKEWQDAFDVTKALIMETKKISNENGAEFLLVILPDKEQIEVEEWDLALEEYPVMKTLSFDLEKPNRVLKELCEQNNIDCLFLLDDFREVYANGTKLYYSKDRHWNEEGNKLAADLVISYLSQ
ncbi:MAG: SGNH/GDSL hydrolase family protein [Candidatus Nanoarchaeia archaeon]|nr:SGNH/GDSL hydrolase family protein [Candidatus Nanoarchaeia archaeon]